MRDNPTRRAFLRQWLTLPAVSSVSMTSVALPAPAAGQPLTLTPACDDHGDATPSQTEGPFHTPGSPRRHDLVPANAEGERVTLAGVVLTPQCRPVAGALVDIWHADAGGAYDTEGFRFRGHQFTDASGRYWARTVRPGFYGSRTRHYHVKVQAPGGAILTTQLYFPDEDRNGTDWLFDAALVMAMAGSEDDVIGRFDFVVEA